MMQIYDITQELFGGKVYPGDPAPAYERVLSMEDGAPCNLTKLQMGAHNATHMDAPYHFYKDGKTIEQIELKRCVGPCTVLEWNGQIDELITTLPTSQKRLILKGNGIVTLEAAKAMIEFGILLIGVESQSVGPVGAPMQVHLELLGKEVILLEGLVLDEVPAGDYFLSAAPLKLGGSDGAPCRAILLKFDESHTCNY
jgi:arylformamidase